MPPITIFDRQLRVFGQPIEVHSDHRSLSYTLRVLIHGRVYQICVHRYELEDYNALEILERFAEHIRSERHANDHESLGPAVTTMVTADASQTMLAQEEVEHHGIHFNIDFERRAIPAKIKALGTASLELPKPKPKMRVVRFKKRLQSLAQEKE